MLRSLEWATGQPLPHSLPTWSATPIQGRTGVGAPPASVPAAAESEAKPGESIASLPDSPDTRPSGHVPKRLEIPAFTPPPSKALSGPFSHI